MIFSALAFTSCKDDEDEDLCADGEHEWKNEQNEQKRKIKQERSCTKPEIRVRECKNCSHKEDYESLPPSGHRYNSTLKVNLQDATCTEDGHTVTHCTYYKICGSEADKVEVLVGSKLGHSYVNYVRTADGYSAIAKCIRCSETSEKLLGLKLDMEGDRSHLSYQKMAIYTGSASGAAEYKTDDSGDTYLSVSRPADYQGNNAFGVILSPEVENIIGNTYVIEGDFIFDKDATGDLVIFKGVKSQLNQSMAFLTYDSETDTVCSLDGAVYTLTEADFGNALKISLLIDDANQIYQVYINDKLASYRPIAFVGDYFPGVPLKSFEITMTDKGASSFGVDDIYLYNADYPNGFDNEAIDGSNSNITYGVKTLLSGQSISYKLPVLTEEHTAHNFANPVVYQPDCVVSGYTIATCDGCGGQQISNEVAANGHSWDSGVNIEPNCFEAGFMVFTCGDCGQKRGDQTAPAKGHTHGDDAVFHSATCSKDAYTEGNCVDCGVYYIKEDKGTMTGHQLGEDVIVVEPTCSVDGGVSGKCKFCGIDYTDPDTVVKAYGHYDFDFSPFTTVPYTCDSDGYEEHTCLGCGETYRENEIPAPGHKKYSYVDGDQLITKCRSCALIETLTIYTGDSVPAYEEMMTGIGEGNFIEELYANKGTISDRGKLDSEDGFRYAVLTNKTEGTNTYAQVELNASRNFTKVSSDHAHIDWGSGNKATKKPLILEFDVKYPTLTSDQIGAGMYIQGYIAGPQTYNTASIEVGGKITVGGAEVGQVTSDKWTKIALTANYETKVGQVYVDGKLVGTYAIGGAFSYIDKFRINFNRDKNKNAFICIDNVYCYYGDTPVYITGGGDAGPTISNDLAPSTAVLHTPKDDDKADFSDYVTKIGGANIVYKEHAKFSLVYNDDGDQIADAIRYQFNDVVASYPPNTSSDTHFTVFGLANGGVYTIRTKIKFNEVTGSVALVQGRREKGGPAGSTNPQYNFAQFSYVGNDGDGNAYGRITSSGQAVWTVHKGDTLDIYVVDNEKTMMYDLYINGNLVLENYYYGNAASDYVYPHTGGLTYKMFNQAYGYDASKPTRFLDINIEDIKFYVGVAVPEDYAGKTFGDKVLAGEEQTILSFSENNSIGKLFGANNNKVPGGYMYSAVEGKSYLALTTNPATVVPTGNVRYVMIDPNGKEVESGGVWTYATNDFATNGNPTDPYFTFTKFDGVPVNADGSYNFLGYKQLRIRVFVKDVKVGGYKLGVHVESPNSTGSNYIQGYNPDGTPIYYTQAGWCYKTFFAGTLKNGWNDIVVNIDANAFNNQRGGNWGAVSEINFNFSGWNYGQHTNTSCTTANCTTGSHYTPVDGLSLYVESFAVIGNGATLQGTGYTMTESPCLEHTFGDPIVGATAENCGDANYSYQVCSVCNYVEIIEATVKEHNFKLVESESTAATCTADGANVYECEECGVKIKEHIVKSLHDFVLKEDATEAEGYLAPTCTEKGQDVYVCANENCPETGKTFVVATDAVGHVHGETVTVDEADCDSDKTTTGDCAVCGELYVKVEEGTKLGHHMVTEETPVKCDEDGHVTVKCDREGCGYVEQDYDVPMTGHTRPGKYLITYIEKTCATFKGIEYNCYTCGERVAEYEEELGKEPHRWGELTLVFDATCGKDGANEAICEVCGLAMSEYGSIEEKQLCIIPATGEHQYDYSQYVYSSDNVNEVRTKYYACTVCGQSDPDSIVEVPAEYNGTDGLIFSDNKNGAYVITGYTGTDKNIVLPSVYSGKPVVLGDVFVGNTEITSVEIPSGVKVTAGAFKGCTALVSVKLPDDMTVLPADLFYGCTSLKTIVLPENCAVISAGAFYGCSALVSIEIKAELTAVEQFAFAGCDALATVKYRTAYCPEIVISTNGNDKLIAAAWVTE